MIRCLIILFLIWTSLLSSGTYASNGEDRIKRSLEPVPVWNNTDAENLSPHASVFIDQTTAITFDELISNPTYTFEPLNKPLANFGMSDDVVWIHYAIQNFHEETSPYYLAIPYSLLDQIDLYIKRATTTEHHLLGEVVPMSERPIRSVIPIQEILLGAHEKVDLYLRVQTQSSIIVPTLIFGKEPMLHYFEINNVLNGVIYGAAGGLIVYSLFIFIILREKVYLFFILSSLCSLAVVLMVDGFTSYIPSIGTRWGEQPTMDFLLFSNFFALQLTRYFLGMVKTSTWMNRFSIFLICCQAFLLLLTVFTNGQNQTVGHFVLAVSLTTALYMLVVSAICAIKGFRPAILLTLGWSMSILAVFLTIFATAGVIGNLFMALSGTKVCFVINMVFISIALANLINELKAAHFEKEQEAAKAQAANSAKGQFLAKMSHEIRTPLNGVIGMAQLVNDTDLNDTQGQYVSTIISSGNALLSIINDILDYSKIESGKLEIEDIDYDLYELLSEVSDLFVIQAHNKQLKLIGQFQDDIPRQVRGDPTRVKQILSNYLSNAFKFTEQGKIEISISLVQNESDDLFIKICVTDSGIGIKKEITEKLFEDFSQADSSISRKYGGTGLGLAICKELSNLMGGTVGVDSTEGQGSSFWFTVKLQTASGSYKPWLNSSILESQCILIDDDLDFTHRFAQELNSRKIKLLQYDTTDHAIAELTNTTATQPIKEDIIILIEGSQFGQRPEKTITALKSVLKNSRVKVFALSSFATQIRFNQQFLQGIIVKSVFAFQTLLQIQRLLNDPHTSSKQQNKLIHSPTTVLVADDNTVNLRIIEAMLKNWNVTVITAQDGVQACRQYQDHHQEIDLILMDCEMPYMSGYEATESMREYERENQLKPTPIIALSAHVINEYVEKAMDSGMNDFVSKPIKKEALYATLEKWLHAQETKNAS